MSRDWQAYLADIRTACEKVAEFTAGMDREAFFGDDRTYHAVATPVSMQGSLPNCIDRLG